MYCFYKSRSRAKSYRWNICWSSNGISAIGILWVCYILPKKEGMEEEFAHRWIHDELGQSYEWYIFFYFYFLYFFLFFHLNLTRSHNFTILAGVSIVFVGCVKLVWLFWFHSVFLCFLSWNRGAAHIENENIVDYRV